MRCACHLHSCSSSHGGTPECGSSAPGGGKDAPARIPARRRLFIEEPWQTRTVGPADAPTALWYPNSILLLAPPVHVDAAIGAAPRGATGPTEEASFEPPGLRAFPGWDPFVSLTTTRKRPTSGAPVLPTNGALLVRH